MALQQVYSFDKIQTADLAALPMAISVAGGCTVNATGGRDATGALVTTSVLNNTAGGGFNVAFDRHADVTFGAWVVIPSAPLDNNRSMVVFGNPDASFVNSPDCAVAIVARPDGSLGAWTGNPGFGAFLGASAAGVITFGASASHYIEVRVVIGAAGSVRIRVNGAVVLTLDPVDTQVLATTDITHLMFGAPSGGGSVRYDDVYINNGTDLADGWTGFMGVLKVNAKLVTANGDTIQWTPSNPTNVNYDNINESTPNPAEFNDAPTVGLQDIFHLEDVVFDPVAVQVDLYMRKLDAGPSSISHVVKSGSTTTVGPEQTALTTGFKYYKKAYTQNPTIGPWTQSSYNGLQAGVQKVV